MAERIALGAYDQLHHFVSAGVWDVAPVETELLIQADKLVGGRDAVLVIDDTAVLKKGTHSVGVAPQYCSALGKNANYQNLNIARWRRAKCRSWRQCDCSFPKAGRMTESSIGSERAFQSGTGPHGRSQRLPWRRSIV